MDAGKLGSSEPTIFSELLDPEKNYRKPIPTMEIKDEVHSGNIDGLERVK